LSRIFLSVFIIAKNLGFWNAVLVLSKDEVHGNYTEEFLIFEFCNFQKNYEIINF